MFRKILSVGGWTLVSRITGFGRDVVMAAVLGAGPIADAFVVAFRLPNHFRAIFGEGAFNSAFVPTYGSLRQTAGDMTAMLFANRIATLMILVQIVLLGLALAFMPQLVGLLAPGLPPATFDLAVTLTRITFPYLFFITLVTLISGVLNANDRFWAAAAAPVLLNLSMIAALLCAAFFPSAGHAVAWGVSIAGLLELILVWANAARHGIAPRPARLAKDASIGRFFRLLGPAVVGSAGIQLAMFADTIIASTLPTGALSALYYAERLYQLPLGVVGIAAGTVLLPEMTRRIAGGDTAGAHAAQNRALGLTLALAAPCAVAFVILPDLILASLFQRGAFDAAAVTRSANVLSAYAIGLPAAVILRSMTASFFARQDTTTPLWASFAGYGVNIALKIVLIDHWGVVGLALATSVGAWTNVLILWLLALRRGFTAPSRSLVMTLVAVACGCALLAVIGIFGRAPLEAALGPHAGPLTHLATLAVLGLAGLVVYGGVVVGTMKAAGVRLGR
ncbi:murein biosynthesis integral membrane protein MurJ [Enterovirga rhinocerotis]|uniref:Probable lipid II flippase MurJ n=1 Tax=Enterovirga rhinocerotis TaxID=1339210 RepID=A0A4R7BU71_9HYPH|nr:murein biosynthesis integral membrane protein MurJ [Enterovirga rhinocerotis]TDR88933.1 putative peptidoglycan lipid II flippase [Enterovirga rhinocerotis]